MTNLLELPKPRNQQADIETRFKKDVSEHQMNVIKNEGVYRHLTFQKPGTSVYYFEIITTPGLLTINGDMGTYVFSRLHDMFEFFGDKQGINPSYWGEKLLAPVNTKNILQSS